MLCKFMVWLPAKGRILNASGRQGGERIGEFQCNWNVLFLKKKTSEANI